MGPQHRFPRNWLKSNAYGGDSRTSKARAVSSKLSMPRSSERSTKLWRILLSGLVPIASISAESPRCSFEGGASTLTQGCQTSATLAVSIRSCNVCCTAARHANVCSPNPQVTMDLLQPLSVAQHVSWRSPSCEKCRSKATIPSTGVCAAQAPGCLSVVTRRTFPAWCTTRCRRCIGGGLR